MLNKILIQKIAVFLLIFFASGTSSVARSFITWDTPAGVLLMGGASILLMVTHGVKIKSNIAYIFIFYWVLFGIQFFWFGSFHPKHMIYYPFSIFIAYIYLVSMREGLFLHIENIITKLSIVSLAIWALDVMSAGRLRAAMHGIYLLPPYDEIVDSYVIFYAVILEGVDSFIPRNSGFAWEPGAFAVFNCLALAINMARTNFRFNSRALILIIAVLSSQSTTGYTILLLLFFLGIFSQLKGLLKMMVVPLLVIFAGIVFSLPFMYEKITNLIEEDVLELADSASQSWNIDKPVAAQRFASFKLDFDDFLENPLTGYGGRDSEQGIRKQGYNIVTVSGVGKILAKFGFFGFLFFIWASFKSSIFFSTRFGFGSDYLILLMILFIGVSYNLIEHPLMMCFWLYYSFSPRFTLQKTDNYVHQTSAGSLV